MGSPPEFLLATERLDLMETTASDLEFVAGQAGLVLQTVGPEEAVEREIGYLLARPYWRRGYATEAALAVKRWAFETLELRRVVSLIRPGNLPSQAVARRIGMAPEREVMFHERPHVVFACANPRLA